MEAILVHRRGVARALLTAGSFGLVAVVSLATAAGYSIGSTIANLLFFVGEIVAIGIFTATVFGGWKILRLAIGDAPRRRTDLFYLAAFTIWVCWTLSGAAVYAYAWFG